MSTRPAANLHLTDRDREIVETLSLRARILSVEQVARTWWNDTANAHALARRRLLRLAEAGRLEWAQYLARPETELRAPLATWRPGAPTPTAASISATGRSRFGEAPKLTSVFWASSASLREALGVTVRRPRAGEITHDLHLAQVFLRYRADRTKLVTGWMAEWNPASTPRRRGARPKAEKKPDALVRTREATVAVEFVGHYTPDKLRDFHTYCASRGYWYELW